MEVEERGVFPEAIAHETRTNDDTTSQNSVSPISRMIPIAALAAGALK